MSKTYATCPRSPVESTWPTMCYILSNSLATWQWGVPCVTYISYGIYAILERSHVNLKQINKCTLTVGNKINGWSKIWCTFKILPRVSTNEKRRSSALILKPQNSLRSLTGKLPTYVCLLVASGPSLWLFNNTVSKCWLYWQKVERLYGDAFQITTPLHLPPSKKIVTRREEFVVCT